MFYLVTVPVWDSTSNKSLGDFKVWDTLSGKINFRLVAIFCNQFEADIAARLFNARG